MKSEKKFIVGIDLGTTNTSVSYAELEDKKNGPFSIHKLQIPQLVKPGKFSDLPVLPSFLYIPGRYDILPEYMITPWKIEHRSREDKNFAGKFARDYGSKIPSRLVSSAKSWLCNKSVDRKARILPWGSNEDIFKISPVQAAASYLKHIRKAWNVARGDDASSYLENQMIIITIPASFDEIARDLTLKSAKMAGLQNIILLEEPLAAFYSWLSENEKKWLKYLRIDQVILVCDVGGGTTDFTLICLKKIEGKPRFERLAVGDHLILGGDNIDISLAKIAVKQLYGNTEVISNDTWNSLCQQCRKLKEKILDGKSTSGKVIVAGKGSNLISNILTTTIKLEDVYKVIYEKFFPDTIKMSGHNEVFGQNYPDQGLQYEKNRSITHHLANFIEKNQPEIKKFLNTASTCPDFVLFNGGSLKSHSIQNRIISSLEKKFNNSHCKPIILKNKDIDAAVSLGATYYGLIKAGYNGLKVGSGSSRTFYIGIKEKNSTNNKALSKQAICLVERGLEEGSTISLPQKQFEVLTNQPISIEVYSSSFRSGDRCGDIIDVDNTLTTLPPTHTIIKFGGKEIFSKISINIEATYTEVGTLELWCKSITTQHKWQINFQLRSTKAQSNVKETEIFDDKKIKLACNAVQHAFSQNVDDSVLTALKKNITKVVKRDKYRWPLNLIRRLADTALEYTNMRKISPNFESRWMNFVGFCLRPGVGEGFDSYRIEKLWKFYKQGPIHFNNQQVRSEWWIMWRRIAAGLNSGKQQQFIQDITPILLEKKDYKKPKQEKIEIWMAAANMEGINSKDKLKMGRQLLDEIGKKKMSRQLLWTLSRLGARNPLYSSIDRVIDQKEISKWLTKIMTIRWRNPKPVIEVISHLAQKTGDQVRDIEPELRSEVNKWINSFGAFPYYTEKINKIVKRGEKEQKIVFGDSIPSGIVFKHKSRN